VDAPGTPAVQCAFRGTGRATGAVPEPGKRVTADDIRTKIETSIPGAEAEVSGAEAHYSAVVVSPAFEGKSRIDRHQMIYALFKDEMAREEIHALSLKTTTPAERRAAAVRMET
jgi:acid stress-induced BolA-like protein IbaG/YrbA